MINYTLSGGILLLSVIAYGQSTSNQDNTMVLGGTTEKDRVSVGIGTQNPNSLSSLELADVDKGFLVNRLNSEQVEQFEMALGMNEEGMMIYNSSIEAMQVWNGVEWKNVGAEKLEMKDDQLVMNKESTVDLSTFHQDLKSATVSGKQLTIQIENGESVSVDLSPVFQEYEERLLALESKLDALVADESDQVLKGGTKVEEARLYQNAPNPFNGSSTVKYFIPKGTSSAYLVLQNNSGKIMFNEKLLVREGDGDKSIVADNFTPGVYYLSLYVDRKKADSISMVVR